MAYKFDFSSKKPHRLYKFMKPIANLVVKSKYKTTYIGAENVPTGRGIILASNHLTALDPVIIAAGVPQITLSFMAKQELFEKTIVGWFLAQLNSFPVDRSKFDMNAINYAVDIVKNGGALGIFPEGTRSEDFKPGKAKGGVCYVAKECKCDIVPVSLYTEDEAKSGTKLTIRYGKPIKYEELGFNEESKKMKDLRKSGEVVMARITELWEQGHGN